MELIRGEPLLRAAVAGDGRAPGRRPFGRSRSNLGPGSCGKAIPGTATSSSTAARSRSRDRRDRSDARPGARRRGDRAHPRRAADGVGSRSRRYRAFGLDRRDFLEAVTGHAVSDARAHHLVDERLAADRHAKPTRPTLAAPPPIGGRSALAVPADDRTTEGEARRPDPAYTADMPETVTPAPHIPTTARPIRPSATRRALTDGPDRAGARAMLKAIGFTDDDLAKPLVGVGTTWIETMPCNFNQRRLAEHVKEGIRAAGGTPMEFNTVSVSDGVSMGTEGMKASLDQPRGRRRLDRARRPRAPARWRRLPGRLRQDDPWRGDGPRPARPSRA